MTISPCAKQKCNCFPTASTFNFCQGPRGEAKRRGPKSCVDSGCCRILWPSIEVTELPLFGFSKCLGYLVATEHWDWRSLQVMAWTKEWTELWSEDRALADLRLLVQGIHQIVCLKLMDSHMKKTWQVSSWTFPRQGLKNQSLQPSRRGFLFYPTFPTHWLQVVFCPKIAPPKILVVYIIIFIIFPIFSYIFPIGIQ